MITAFVIKELSELIKINESRYIALFLASGSIKKLLSIDCVNIYFSQSIHNNAFSIFFQKCGVTPHCLYRDSLTLILEKKCADL